jgi:carbohydrate-binding DOMON domain-containing protein
LIDCVLKKKQTNYKQQQFTRAVTRHKSDNNNYKERGIHIPIHTHTHTHTQAHTHTNTHTQTHTHAQTHTQTHTHTHTHAHTHAHTHTHITNNLKKFSPVDTVSMLDHGMVGVVGAVIRVGV